MVDDEVNPGWEGLDAGSDRALGLEPDILARPKLWRLACDRRDGSNTDSWTGTEGPTQTLSEGIQCRARPLSR